MRDRAIVFCALSTGLRRAELVGLDLDQLEPSRPDDLRTARRARLLRVRGKGGTERTVFLSADARAALADYVENERPGDVDEHSTALFLAARSISSRRPGGRLSVRTINDVCDRVGSWQDGEQAEPDRRLDGLHPHDLRHTFAFRLAEETGKDPYELERRLGHRSQRYIARYTNPPEHVAAGYAERL
jgi:integrase